ncbi:MAG: gamma-glutamyltransferase [Pseudomonadota bacterium]|nr:gamma-glutamyltransferase [Pseudomonadota bacterium]
MFPFAIAFGSSTSTVNQDLKPTRAAISTADPIATAVGMKVLAEGGNAFDAAVAITSTLAVVEPAGSGLGGGGFFLLYLAETDEYRFVDAREIAPKAAYRDMYLDDQGKPIPRASVDGPLAAGIPGIPAGLVYLNNQFGSMPLSDLLAPAIEFAENGFSIGSRAIRGLNFRTNAILRSSAMSEVFLPDGEVPEEGTVIFQPALAKTLKRFSNQGLDGFYKGETASLLVNGVRAAGGIWTLDDLADYEVIERQPLVAKYKNMRVISAPLPSSGGIVISQILDFLSAYNLEELTEAQRIHYEVEAMRRAYRDRALYLGDDDFSEIPLDKLLDKRYLAEQRASFKLDQASSSINLFSEDDQRAEGNQTTHFSVLDSRGNRVAATITVNTWYGSAFMAPETGVILNNEMDDFSIKPGVPNDFGLVGGRANEVVPGKRPLSSMSPSFLESDRGIAILGTPGGSRIITMVLRSALHWYQGGSAEEMVNLKRYHHQYLPDRIEYELGSISKEAQAELLGMGHQLSLARRPFGNMNVVTWDYSNGKVTAASDSRGEGEGRVY